MEYSVRVKCRKMLESALQMDDLDDLAEGSGHIKNLAFQLEQAIYDELYDLEVKYKNRIRSRLSNLRDPKNPGLRDKFLRGIISPKQLAKMTPEEMASDELKQMRQQFVQDSIHKAQKAEMAQGTKTDLFKCSRCKKRNCVQLHTQDGDEPIMTFVMCEECGNRWKT
ncbi:transcription elongation factor S-II [Drosophila gunungcola]|uniref:Transcription elongation factor S-II n=1 Tax=Drosophila gunungcola TaxID=103775 RepID=A0A9P9YA72_9MUSC|nr:transcription elongation factor S-II [Drosophila gunungcola]KAI8033226.1 hypothetical protein M5D96_014015 [Drosophila gunungcola]